MCPEKNSNSNLYTNEERGQDKKNQPKYIFHLRSPKDAYYKLKYHVATTTHRVSVEEYY